MRGHNSTYVCIKHYMTFITELISCESPADLLTDDIRSSQTVLMAQTAKNDY